MSTTIFITGGTGYIGSRLIKVLQKEGGFHIKALVRKGSEHKLPPGCEIIYGNALKADTYKDFVSSSSIFVHLIGVAHPSPSKKQLFRSVDAVSIQEAVKAATEGGCKHFIYLSVSQYPSGIMKEYQGVRAEGEKLLATTGMKCSFIRPWYVLGPGHWWPLLLKPAYWIARLIPSWREKAMRHDLVSIHQMIETLMYAVKNPPSKQIEKYEIADIKNIRYKHINLLPVL